jgi:7-cyano-7-deazaguanine synthase
MVKGTQRAAVLLSGGMDSCVCAALAVCDHDAAAVHASYGQRTEERERQFFSPSAIAWAFGTGWW